MLRAWRFRDCAGWALSGPGLYNPRVNLKRPQSSSLISPAAPPPEKNKRERERETNATRRHKKESSGHELRFHRKRRSISGEGFFCDGDPMHVTDTEPESYEDRFQRLGQRTYFFFLGVETGGDRVKRIYDCKQVGGWWRRLDRRHHLPPCFVKKISTPSCKDHRAAKIVKKEEARNDREGCMMSDGEQGRRRPVHTAAAPV
ncbi:hypothetical protein Rs2_04129 [Raphanus sativus]|nr:hypothetical protein Rs2_04129 [Raphanus sativus]